MIMALWMGAIAIVSVQNATPVRIHFGFWQSIHLPFGVVLTLGVICGLFLAILFGHRRLGRHF